MGASAMMGRGSVFQKLFTSFLYHTSFLARNRSPDEGIGLVFISPNTLRRNLRVLGIIHHQRSAVAFYSPSNFT